jgi:hypothetical protein
MPTGPAPKLDLSKKQLTSLSDALLQRGHDKRSLFLHDNLLTSLPSAFALSMYQVNGFNYVCVCLKKQNRPPKKYIAC